MGKCKAIAKPWKIGTGNKRWFATAAPEREDCSAKIASPSSLK
jgi:hypothetical protein